MWGETQKAQRCFKECGIKFQFIDMNEKEISKGDKDTDCQKWKAGDCGICTGGLEELGVRVKLICLQ